MTRSIPFRDRSRRLPGLLLLLLLFWSGLAASDVRNEIRKTILSYNRTLIEAAKNPDFLKSFDDRRKFEPFAEKRVAQKLYIWIKSWHENNLYMDADLRSIDFKRIDIAGDQATAVTNEVWVYRYFRHLDVNETAEAYAPTKIEYRVRYSLANDSGRWKITKIDVLSETEQRL